MNNEPDPAAAAQLMQAAHDFFNFATTSPPTDPRRLINLLHLVDRLNSAAAHFEHRKAGEYPDPSPEQQQALDNICANWPELGLYPDSPTVAQYFEEGDEAIGLGDAGDDVLDICGEIARAIMVEQSLGVVEAALLLRDTYAWHWGPHHIHGLRNNLFEMLYSDYGEKLGGV